MIIPRSTTLIEGGLVPPGSVQLIYTLHNVRGGPSEFKLTLKREHISALTLYMMPVVISLYMFESRWGTNLLAEGRIHSGFLSLSPSTVETSFPYLYPSIKSNLIISQKARWLDGMNKYPVLFKDHHDAVTAKLQFMLRWQDELFKTRSVSSLREKAVLLVNKYQGKARLIPGMKQIVEQNWSVSLL
jgi:hypothetical protein